MPDVWAVVGRDLRLHSVANVRLPRKRPRDGDRVSAFPRKRPCERGRAPLSLFDSGERVVAELVAKVTYNETDPDDEFDEDSGWWIAPCVKTVLEEIGDAGFERSMWLMLISDPLA